MISYHSFFHLFQLSVEKSISNELKHLNVSTYWQLRISIMWEIFKWTFLIERLGESNESHMLQGKDVKTKHHWICPFIYRITIFLNRHSNSSLSIDVNFSQFDLTSEFIAKKDNNSLGTLWKKSIINQYCKQSISKFSY